jgi:cytochrome c
MHRGVIYIFTVSTLLLSANAGLAQDIAAGEKVFAKCKACHVVDSDKNKIGPSLQGLFGRAAGSVEGFKYSAPMVDAGKAGTNWDETSLAPYLKDPKGTIKGTKMAFVGLKSDDDIANVIAYLKQFSE